MEYVAIKYSGSSLMYEFVFVVIVLPLMKTLNFVAVSVSTLSFTVNGSSNQGKKRIRI